MYKFLGGIQNCIEDGLGVLGKNHSDMRNIEVKVWKQMWSDTSCGFGGIAGMAFTNAYTIVVIDEYTGRCAVFHNFRFAYQTVIGEDVEKQILNQKLIGAQEFKMNLRKD